jgi:N utilization substance protein A
MSQEIVEAVREIEREKGIETGTLVAALEDALLAAYKKTPGASLHAAVVLGGAGDFTCSRSSCRPTRGVCSARRASARSTNRAARGGDEKNHTLLSDDDLDVTSRNCPRTDRRETTPDNFGRIAAQTAKQVIRSDPQAERE